MLEAQVGLLERSDELAHLAALVGEARSGRGAVAVIEGPAGIGKTSVLTAARELAARNGLQVLSARAGLLERDLAWSLVRQLFAGVIRAGEARRLELLDGAAGLARPALGLSEDRSSGADEAAALHGLYWLTSTLSEPGPLLLAVDDAHWGDLPSLRFLAYIAERVADLPLLLAATVRTGEPQDAHLQAVGLHAGTRRMVLHELSLEATHELTREALGTDSAPEFCDACHAASRGNPFVLRELLAQLAHDRVAPTAARAHEVARVTPESVKRSILLRLSVLPEEARELSVALAVLGGDIELRPLAAVAGLDASAAGSAADALTSAGILAPGVPVRFAHPLVREVLYGQLPAHERARRHREAADVLHALGSDVQRVAVQLLEANSLGDEWVVDRLRAAAAAALSQGAGGPAVDFLTRALNEPPPHRLRISVLRELAAAEALIDSASAAAHLEEAYAAADDPGIRAQLGLELALMLHRQSDLARAFELGRSVLERLPPGDSLLELRVIAASVTGAILTPALRPHIEPFLSRIAPDLVEGTPEACLARSAELAAACARLASMTTIGDLAERALGGGKMLEALPFHELLYWNATSALILAERFDVAGAAIDAGFEHARTHGSIVGFALASAFRCKLDHRLGRIAEGTADGWHALSGLARGEAHIKAYAAAFLIDCLIERGEPIEALGLANAPEFTGRLPETSGFHLLRVARARARIDAGDPRPAVDELLEVGGQMGEGQFGPAMNPWRARASVGLSALGQRDRACGLAQEELSLARRTESRWAEVLALQALALAAPADADDHLGQSVEIAERAGLGLEHARSLIALGALRRRRGRRQAAIELLEHGLELSIAGGALALEERARTELSAAGMRPRRRQSTGRDALTGGEQRVAQLAAQGMTNREIAQALFVSLRTVETHLTHSYQKLGIDSRAQLAGALVEADPSGRARPAVAATARSASGPR